MREGARRPEFSQHLSRTVVVEGGVAKLECKVSGNPAPAVRWLKERRALGDDLSYAAACEEGELYSLCISATYAEHAGWYACVATNDVGTAISEARLTVERTPACLPTSFAYLLYNRDIPSQRHHPRTYTVRPPVQLYLYSPGYRV